MTKKQDVPVSADRLMDLGAGRLSDLEALARLIDYTEVELRQIAPGCGVIANLLRMAISHEIIVEIARISSASVAAEHEPANSRQLKR